MSTPESGKTFSGFPMSIELNKCDQGIGHPLSMICDERRRPRQGAPAADQFVIFHLADLYR
jgi:hypothetical protein